MTSPNKLAERHNRGCSGYQLVSWSSMGKKIIACLCTLLDMFNPNEHPGRSKEWVKKKNVKAGGCGHWEVSNAWVGGWPYTHVNMSLIGRSGLWEGGRHGERLGDYGGNEWGPECIWSFIVYMYKIFRVLFCNLVWEAQFESQILWIAYFLTS